MSTAHESANPHRATRAAKRSCLSRSKIEAEADMPTWSRGLKGIRKPSVSPALRFCPSSDEVAKAWEGSDFGCCHWIDDAETTVADVTDSAADSSDSQDSGEVTEPGNVNSVNEASNISIASHAPIDCGTPKENERQAQAEDIPCDVRKQVEQKVSVIKAIVEAQACAHAESILTAAKMRAESEARAIKNQAFADACTLKARVEFQAQAKAEATLAEMRASVEKEQARKAAVGLRHAKDLDQQRARKQSKQTREERCFQQGLDQMRSQVEAECCEVKERALAEAKAAKARAVADARAIRAKARSSVKLEDRRGRPATENITTKEGSEVVDVSEVVGNGPDYSESQAELTTMRSEPETEPVDAFPVSLVVTQDVESPLVDIDVGWEVLPDSSLESIPGWDVIA